MESPLLYEVTIGRIFLSMNKLLRKSMKPVLYQTHKHISISTNFISYLNYDIVNLLHDCNLEVVPNLNYDNGLKCWGNIISFCSCQSTGILLFLFRTQSTNIFSVLSHHIWFVLQSYLLRHVPFLPRAVHCHNHSRLSTSPVLHQLILRMLGIHQELYLQASCCMRIHQELYRCCHIQFLL